jgi:hypothetical protein
LQWNPAAPGLLHLEAQFFLISMHAFLVRQWKVVADCFENLPAFWAVFALILVETIGEGVLAIPIAVAKIGPLAGVGVLLVIGIVNTITILSIAEASARNGSIRYGVAYLGHVVQDYLGKSWAFVLVVAVTVIQILALISYYVGFATTMAEATRLPAAAWAGAIFLVCFYFLMRGSFASAIGFVFLIGGLNVATVVVLLLMTIPHIQPDHLAFSSWTSAGAFDPSWLQLVFGVIFSAYLGHLGVANSAQFALRRDSSARAHPRECGRANHADRYLFALGGRGKRRAQPPRSRRGIRHRAGAARFSARPGDLRARLVFDLSGHRRGFHRHRLGPFLPGQGVAAQLQDLFDTGSEFASATGFVRPGFLVLCQPGGHRFRIRGMASADGNALVHEPTQLSRRAGRATHRGSLSADAACGQPSKG